MIFVLVLVSISSVMSILAVYFAYTILKDSIDCRKTTQGIAEEFKKLNDRVERTLEGLNARANEMQDIQINLKAIFENIHNDVVKYINDVAKQSERVHRLEVENTKLEKALIKAKRRRKNENNVAI